MTQNLHLKPLRLNVNTVVITASVLWNFCK